MDALTQFEVEIVSWLNQGIGRFYLLDRLTYLAVSDYFVPLVTSLWGLALWFCGKDIAEQRRNQKAVLGAAISLGIANLVVLILNQFFFRERPFVHYELSNLLYYPTDSSFPANPAAVAFAFATAVWLRNRRMAAPLFFLAGVWSFVRVYNGLFYPTDVAAGALIGVCVACVITLGLKAVEPLPTWVLRGARLLHLA